MSELMLSCISSASKRRRFTCKAVNTNCSWLDVAFVQRFAHPSNVVLLQLALELA